MTNPHVPRSGLVLLATGLVAIIAVAIFHPSTPKPHPTPASHPTFGPWPVPVIVSPSPVLVPVPAPAPDPVPVDPPVAPAPVVITQTRTVTKYVPAPTNPKHGKGDEQ